MFHIALGFLHMIFENVSKDVSTDESSKVNLKKLNESLINNSVLCIINCIESDGEGDKVCVELTKTNIVMDLIYLARDGLRKDLQKNCGILLAKMSKKNNK